MFHLARPGRVAFAALALCVISSSAFNAAAQTKASGKIAFDSNRDGGAGEIYVMFPNGGAPTRLTFAGINAHPVWSPDGSKIAFIRFTSPATSDVWVMNADGSGQTNLTNTPSASHSRPDWSPDGSKIAFTSNYDGNFEIYAMNAGGGNVTRLTNHAAGDAFPDWSPDGSKIAFSSNRDGGLDNDEIYVMNADGSNVVRLTNSVGHDTLPDWSPDGAQLIFRSARDGNSEIYVMNADGAGQTNISNNAANDDRPDWSPDGSRIAFVSTRDTGSTFDIYVMNPSGGGVTRLTSNAANDDNPAWQPVRVTNPGEVIISEFRSHGGNASDEYVELYNNTDSPITVGTTDGSNGWALSVITNFGATSVVGMTVLNGTVIPARGHYLGASGAFIGGYSLTGYAVPDGAIIIPTADGIADNGGVAIFRTANPSNFNVGNRLDAVGSDTLSPADLHRENTGLPPSNTSDSAVQPAWVRKFLNSGFHQDTNNNAQDFILVTTDGSALNGTPSVLGAPGPESLSSPVFRPSVFVDRFDVMAAVSSPPNRVRDTTPVANGTLGTLSFRRRVTNYTGQTVTRMRFRIRLITTAPAPSGTADLRAITSPDITVNGQPVKGTTLEPPSTPSNGGGWNSSWSVALPAPLASGASFNVQLVVGVQQGGSFSILINSEVLP